MKLQSLMVRAVLVAAMAMHSAMAAQASPATVAVSAGAGSNGVKGVAAPVRGDAVELLLGGAGDHRLVLLGEMHGTRETPELVAALLQRLSARGESLASDKAWDAHLLLPGFTASPPATSVGG